jgi:hypothetical protein
VQCWDESSGGVKTVLIKPENLETIKWALLDVIKINVQGGGILAGFEFGEPWLSFEWLECVSEEPPWYFVPDPPDAKWREPFTENEVERLRAVSKTKLEQCLVNDDHNGVDAWKKI